jgi:hypothetical protein
MATAATFFTRSVIFVLLVGDQQKWPHHTYIMFVDPSTVGSGVVVDQFLKTLICKENTLHKYIRLLFTNTKVCWDTFALDLCWLVWSELVPIWLDHPLQPLSFFLDLVTLSSC